MAETSEAFVEQVVENHELRMAHGDNGAVAALEARINDLEARLAACEAEMHRHEEYGEDDESEIEVVEV